MTKIGISPMWECDLDRDESDVENVIYPVDRDEPDVGMCLTATDSL